MKDKKTEKKKKEESVFDKIFVNPYSCSFEGKELKGPAYAPGVVMKRKNPDGSISELHL